MTLVEAVKINKRTGERMVKYGIPVWTEKDIEALRLGIGALKRVMQMRAVKDNIALRLLIGETED